MGCLFLLQPNINAESVPDEVLPDYTDLSKHFQTNIALSERWTDERRNDVLLFHFLGSVDAKQLFFGLGGRKTISRAAGPGEK